MAENILIEFTTDTSGLEPAVDQLEKLGTIDKQSAAAFRATNAELAKRQTTLKATAAATAQSATTTKKSIDDVDKAVNKLTQDFVEGFQEGVTEALKEAGVSAEEFSDAIKKGGTEIDKSSQTIKQRQKEILEQLAQMKLRGEENTQEYKALVKEGGNLRDVMGDVAQEVNNVASDTSAFDGLIGVAQGVTGGFATAAAATAIFGEQGEELGETLLKVNSYMAALQGLQQIQTVLQKESTAVTFLQTAGQKIYNVVIGESIGLMAAFRVALAATGVGLLILGIAALVQILDKEEKALARVNAALDANKKNIEADTRAIEDLAEAEIARAEAAGALESDITRIRGKSLQAQRSAIEEQNQLLTEQRDALDSTSEGYFKLNAAIDENNTKVKEIDTKTRIEAINLGKQQREEELKGIADVAAARLAGTIKNSKDELNAAKAAARAKAVVDINAAGQNAAEILRINAELNDQLLELDRNFAQVRQQNRIAGVEAALIAEQQISQAINARQSQAEIDLQKRLIQEKANLELLQEGLTQNQILQIKRTAQAEILRLQKEFNKQSAEESLQDFISANNAQLAAIDITNKEKLQLTIDNIIAQAEIEVQQNQGLSEKIKEINSKRDADIKSARLQSIQQSVEEEIALRAATGGVDTRGDERLLAAQDQIRAAATEREKRAIEERLAVRRLGLQEEINLIDQIGEKELEAGNIRISALNDSFAQGLISYKDYNLQYTQLTDEQAKITEDTEQKKRNAYAKTEEEQRARNKRTLEFAINTAQQTTELLGQLFAQQAERELQRVEEQRTRITELRESGAITEKEEKQRLKRLEIEERRIRTQQARREKALAIFNAVINTAQAVVAALAVGPPQGFIFAAITAALGAAQIALIASKPIPAFGKGKKNAYEGPARVGETGAELIERDGRLYVAPKETIVYLGAKDKVFNPEETKAILEKPGLHASRVDTLHAEAKINGEKIDYDKLGRAVGKNIPQFGLNIDSNGFNEWLKTATSFNKYLNKRRGYK